MILDFPGSDASVTTTLDVYGHLSVEDARRSLEEAGWFSDTVVRL
ncbi:MAG: hypothetical protein ACYC1D_05925 [Acidimicrobiales bacterium]